MRLRVVALGAGVALAIAFPASLAAQLIDAFADGDDPPEAVYLLLPLILLGVIVGGWAVGRQTADHPAWEGAAAGAVAMAVVLAVGIARRAAAGEDVAWAAVPTSIVAAAGVAAIASAATARTRTRTHP